jgi:hypothetical protein
MMRSVVIRGGLLAGVTAVLTAGVAVAGVASGRYAGSTTQVGAAAGKVHFSVTKNKQTVHAFSGLVFATCKNGGNTNDADITLDPTADMTIKKSAFGFHGNFNIDNAPASGHGPAVVIAKKVAGKISGKFGAHNEATGTMSFTWKFDSNAPAALKGFSCNTGTVKFTAKPK